MLQQRRVYRDDEPRAAKQVVTVRQRKDARNVGILEESMMCWMKGDREK
jgi:hypothetical protein